MDAKKKTNDSSDNEISSSSDSSISSGDRNRNKHHKKSKKYKRSRKASKSKSRRKHKHHKYRKFLLPPESSSSETSSSSSSDDEPPPKKSKSPKEKLQSKKLSTVPNQESKTPVSSTKPDTNLELLSKHRVFNEEEQQQQQHKSRRVETKGVSATKRRTSCSSRERTPEKRSRKTSQESIKYEPTSPPEYCPSSPLQGTSYQTIPTPPYAPDGEDNTIEVPVDQNKKRSIRTQPVKLKNLANKYNLQGSTSTQYCENYCCESCSFQVSHTCKDYFFDRWFEDKAQCKVLQFSPKCREIECPVCRTKFVHPKCNQKNVKQTSDDVFYVKGSITFWSCKNIGCSSRIWHKTVHGGVCNIMKKSKLNGFSMCDCELIEVKHKCQEDLIVCEMPVKY